MKFNTKDLTAEQIYKIAASLIVPRPIGWVSSKSANGIANIAPYSFFNIVSSDPAFVVVGIANKKDGSLKDSAKNIMATKAFALNMVSFELLEQMAITAASFDETVDEFEVAKLETKACSTIDCPCVVRSPAVFECVLHDFLELTPSRKICVGKIVAMDIKDELIIDASQFHLDSAKADIVGRLGGFNYVRVNELLEMTVPDPKEVLQNQQ